MNTHLNKTNQPFSSKFVATAIERYFDCPDDPSIQATCERILAWIAQTTTKRKVGQTYGDATCELIAEKVASRLMANHHLLQNRALESVYKQNDRQGILRVLFAVCNTASADQIREFIRRRIAERLGEEITINGALVDGSVPDALSQQPCAVSQEFEINEIVQLLPIDQQEIVRAALGGLTQREIAQKLGLALAKVNRKINASIQKGAQEPQL